MLTRRGELKDHRSRIKSMGRLGKEIGRGVTKEIEGRRQRREKKRSRGRGDTH